MRLLVSYTIPKSNQHGFVGIDIIGYNTMSAEDIATKIQFDIVDRYSGIHYTDIVITMVKALGEIHEPNPWLKTSFTKCMVCGDNHGSSGLPCPNMSAS